MVTNTDRGPSTKNRNALFIEVTPLPGRSGIGPASMLCLRSCRRVPKHPPAAVSCSGLRRPCAAFDFHQQALGLGVLDGFTSLPLS
jgi:hypothetical protein